MKNNKKIMLWYPLNIILQLESDEVKGQSEEVWIYGKLLWTK